MAALVFDENGDVTTKSTAGRLSAVRKGFIQYKRSPVLSILSHCSFLIIPHTFPSLQTQTTNNNPNNLKPYTMESIKQGANYVAETVQQATSGASKEANKEVAKDSNQGVGTR